MAVPAGKTFAVLDPKILWAPAYNVIPAIDLKLGEAWPTGWNEIYDTVNGLALTFRNPRAAIVGERYGRLGDVSSGDDGVAIGLDVRTPTMDLETIRSSLEKIAVAAVAEVASLTITSVPTAAGNVIVTLDGVATPVAVLTTDTADSVATKIRNTVFAGWTTGGTGTTVTFTATVAGPRADATYSAGTTGSAGTMTTTTQGVPAYNIRHHKRKLTPRFMLGFEGMAIGGSFFDVDTLIRGIAYYAGPTNNAEHIWRSTGADSVFHSNMTLECMASTIKSTQVTGTGINLTDLDTTGKFDYFDTPLI